MGPLYQVRPRQRTPRADAASGRPIGTVLTLGTVLTHGGATMSVKNDSAEAEVRRHNEPGDAANATWPALPLAAWQGTYQTLHMWMQIVGKVRLALSPPVNHWWAVTLYVTPRGLTTSPIPYGTRTFAVTFDFLDHTLRVRTSDNMTRTMALSARAVADFYAEFMSTLDALGMPVTINPVPQEVPNPIRCDEDYEHCFYDAEYATRWWRILMQSDRVLKQFRARFIGKCSPVHFFWGSFDLAVTRFSGRRAPERPGADRMTREAYSHEVSSCGFWPGTPGSSV